MKIKDKGLFVILIICLTLVLIWFGKGFLFAGGEMGIPFYNLTKTTERISYLWTEEEAGYPGVGGITEVPYYSLLTALDPVLPANLIQALHFFLIIFTGTISVYFLLKETAEEELKKINLWAGKFISLTGAVFYLLNPFSMSQVFGRSLNIQYLSFALIPLFLLLFIKGLKSKNLIYGFLSLVPASVWAGAYGSFGYIPALWLVVSLYTLFHILQKREKKEIFFAVFFLSFVFLGWILTNLFWIIPVFKMGGQQLAGSLNAGEENIVSLRGVSRQFSLPVLIRLLHKGYFYEDLYGTSYLGFFLKTVSWLIPFVSLFSIGLFKKLRIFKYFFALFIISLFISLGSNFPTGFLFEAVFARIPAFQMYRNPYEKFGLIFLLAYTPFFAAGTLVFSEKLASLFKSRNFKYILGTGIIFLVCGIFVWPMWKGIFAGGYRINTRIKVPDYYRQANDWLNAEGGDFRLLQLPLIPGDGIRYRWEHPYQGIEPSEFLFDKVSVGQNMAFNKNYYNVLLERIGIFQPNIFGSDPDLTNSNFRSENFYEELAKLNIRYIVLHNDIDTSDTGFKSPAETKAYLKDQPNIEKIKSFGELDIYKVDIPADINLIYSPTASVSYEKINPAFYKATVSAAAPSELFFLSLYNPGWEAFIDGEKINDHDRLFSYANAWKISKTGEFEVILKYKPQELADMSMQFSKYSILIIFAGAVLYFFKRWKLKKS